jgi:hypothetical protein
MCPGTDLRSHFRPRRAQQVVKMDAYGNDIVLTVLLHPFSTVSANRAMHGQIWCTKGLLGVRQLARAVFYQAVICVGRVACFLGRQLAVGQVAWFVGDKIDLDTWLGRIASKAHQQSNSIIGCGTRLVPMMVADTWVWA